MVAANAKVSLSEPKDTRHKFGETSLSMAEEVLKSVESAVRSKISGLEAKVGESDAERAARDVRVTAADASVSEMTEAVKGAQAKLDAAMEESKKAEEELKAAKKQEQDGNAALATMAERKGKLEAVQSGSFSEAKEHPSAKAAKAFVNTAKHFDFDEHMMKHAEDTLAKPVVERGTFDALVLRETELSIQAAVKVAATALANGEPAKAGRAAHVVSASEAAAAKVAEHDAAKVARDEAKFSLAAATLEHKAAVHAVKEFAPELKRVTADLDSAKKEFEKCLAIQATFEELRDRVTPPPAPELEEIAQVDAAEAPAAGAEGDAATTA